MFKKILSPVVYVAFLAITFVIVMMVNFGIVEMFGVSISGAIFLVIPIIIFFGILLFWIANKLVSRFEKLNKPKIADHFRQSFLCYLTLIYLVLYLAWLNPSSGDSFHPQFIYVMVSAIATTIWAIFVNAVYLYESRKINIA